MWTKLWSGVDVEFSRGACLTFQKIFKSFVDLFFRSNELNFRPCALRNPVSDNEVHYGVVSVFELNFFVDTVV